MKVSKKILVTALGLAVPSVGLVLLNRQSSNDINQVASSVDEIPEVVQTIPPAVSNQIPEKKEDYKEPEAAIVVPKTQNNLLPSPVEDSASEYKLSYSSSEFNEEMKKGYVEARNFIVLNRDLESDKYIDGLEPAQAYPDGKPMKPNGIDKGKGDGIIETIQDYTVALFSDGCSRGTGWFLDYVIPENGSYPTKWFIATNAHVADEIKFNDNPYGQAMPDKKNCGNFWVIKDQSVEKTNRRLEKKEQRGNDNMDVKLFYVPTDFVGPRYVKDNEKYKLLPYIQDLAIIEVNFKTAYQARVLTDDFYHKYGPNGRKKENRIKFLNTPKESAQRNYFAGGYPASDKKGQTHSDWIFTHNWTPENKKAGHFVSYGNAWPTWNLKYGNQVRNYWGRLVAIDNSPLYGGASGSLVVDENLNALGLLTGGPSDSEIAFVVPLNWHGAYSTWDQDKGHTGEKKLLYPKYDFIQGAHGQTNSYIQQLKKYFPQEKTHLLQEIENLKR